MTRLVQGIEWCDVFISCITSDYPNRKNTKYEVSTADQYQKPIIPLRFSGKWPPAGQMHMILVELLYINVKNGIDEQKMKQIEKAIEGKHL